MFDLRYHVASLAAVFLALVIGILVGVGIARTGVTSRADLKRARLENRGLETKLEASQAQVGVLERQGSAFLSSYPALMANRLAGRRIVVLFLGTADERVRASVEQALADAGALPPVRLRALKLPVDPAGLAKILRGKPQLARLAGRSRLGDLGRELGRELVAGGDARAWTALAPQLVEERVGVGKQPADGAVIVRATKPWAGATASFVAGLYDGIGAATPSAVAVETSGTLPSAVPAWQRHGLSTVDDVELPTGRLALALLLSGGQPGNYGLKGSARNGLLPPVTPAPAGG